MKDIAQGQGHRSKKVAYPGSHNDRLQLAIFIGSHRMAPQTTHYRWLGLRLEGKLVIILRMPSPPCLLASLSPEYIYTVVQKKTWQSVIWLQLRLILTDFYKTPYLE